MLARTCSTRLSWNAVGRIEIVARDAQPVLRREHLEIRRADAHDGGEDHHLLVEAAGDRILFGCARGRAVLAPEVDLVAGVERGRKEVALGPAARAAETLGEADEVDRRQQRRAGDLGLRVGLHDAPDRSADVEIGDLRLFHQIGELARAEAAPPVESRRRRLPLPGTVFGRDVNGEIRPLGA
jgi:hypothetical protein